MTDWEEVELGTLLQLITKGTTPPKGKGFVAKGVNYIKSDAISYDGTIDFSKIVQIDQETHEKFKRSQLKEGDILFSMAGAFLGKNAIVPKKLVPANTNQALAIIRLEKELANNHFISYCLRNSKMVSYINGMVAQSAQPNINFKEISSLQIELPPIPEQKAIAHVLGKLDEKIELNRKMNQTLESMAQALFKSWFVDFDPVIDNTLAANNPIPEPLKAKAEKRQQLETRNQKLNKLFPSSFEYNETLNKWIPEGWNMDSLGSHLYIKGRIGWKGLKKSEYSPEPTEYRIVNGSDFQNEQINSKSCGWITKERYDESPEIQLQNNDILITKDGTIGKLAFVFELDVKSSVASGVFVVRVESEYLTIMYCWSYFKSALFQQVVKTKIDGSVIPHLYQRDFVEMFIPIPNKKLLEVYETQAKSYFKKVFENKKEIEKLTQLRDTLLPKLISGKVRLPNGLVDGFKE